MVHAEGTAPGALGPVGLRVRVDGTRRRIASRSSRTCRPRSPCRWRTPRAPAHGRTCGRKSPGCLACLRHASGPWHYLGISRHTCIRSACLSALVSTGRAFRWPRRTPQAQTRQGGPSAGLGNPQAPPGLGCRRWGSPTHVVSRRVPVRGRFGRFPPFFFKFVLDFGGPGCVQTHTKTTYVICFHVTHVFGRFLFWGMTAFLNQGFSRNCIESFTTLL